MAPWLPFGVEPGVERSPRSGTPGGDRTTPRIGARTLRAWVRDPNLDDSPAAGIISFCSRPRRRRGPGDMSSSVETVAAPESERVLVFDFGSQYGQLIARRVREQNVFCQIVRHDLPAERVAELRPRGLIFSGGPASVYAP